MRYFLIVIFVFTSLFSFASGEEKKEVIISYGEYPKSLTAYTHYLESNTALKNISKEGGASDELRKKESFRELEVKKDIKVTSVSHMDLEEGSFRYLKNEEKISVIREESDGETRDKYKTFVNETKFDSTGLSQQPIDLAKLSFESFPIVFPRASLKVGQAWSNVQSAKIGDLVFLDLKVNCRLENIRTLAGEEVAEISYTVQSELKSTEVTEDPDMLQRIQLLRSKNIDRISVSGKGTLTFNLKKHLPEVHTMNMIIEVGQKFISTGKRELNDRIQEIYKAEAILSL
ncbi:MAG: hypothetical protein ABIE74_04945 [Pseudomonadota bacterium]